MYKDTNRLYNMNDQYLSRYGSTKIKNLKSWVLKIVENKIKHFNKN